MKKQKIDKRENLIFYLISVFLLILFISEQAFPQGPPNRYRSRGMDESNLPEQRSPLLNSKLNLRDIPYKIVYESFQETGGSSNWDICMINSDGSNFINLTSTPDINEFYPHASPDGTKICFVAVEGDTRENRSRNVYFMNIDGSGLTKIADNAYQPCWSGDGKQIAYMKGEYSRYSGSSWSNRGMEIYDLTTKETEQHPDPDLGLLFNLCWSPDGNWFTATSRARSYRGGNIVFRTDDTVKTSISIHGCRPDISPDGKQLAWNRSDHVVTIGSLDLSSPQNNVTNTKHVIACHEDYKIYHVDWSPDGNYLTFSYGPSRGDQAVGRKAAGWNICICDLSTGEWIQITSDGKHNKEPDWVPVKIH
jgi:Tol biopolymer transport system component